MKRISTAALRELEVINLCGGERLGYPCDFEIDLDDGTILALIVRDSGGFAFFSKKEEFLIPWCNIECIGEDAILVKLSGSDLTSCSCSSKGGRKGKKFR